MQHGHHGGASPVDRTLLDPPGAFPADLQYNLDGPARPLRASEQRPPLPPPPPPGDATSPPLPAQSPPHSPSYPMAPPQPRVPVEQQPTRGHWGRDGPDPIYTGHWSALGLTETPDLFKDINAMEKRSHYDSALKCAYHTPCARWRRRMIMLPAVCRVFSARIAACICGYKGIAPPRN
jgi:hypothetical protein